MYGLFIIKFTVDFHSGEIAAQLNIFQSLPFPTQADIGYLL